MTRKERKIDLENKLSKQRQLLSDYEYKIDLSDDPRDIANYEAEVDRIKDRIQQYINELTTLKPIQSVNQLLVSSFTAINFTEQRFHITNHYQQNNSGAMLIHGAPNFGQNWLSFLLENDLKNSFEETTLVKIEIDFNDFLFPDPWTKLLTELRNNFNILGNSEVELVQNGIKTLSERLRSEVILFLFRNPMNFLHTPSAKKFLNDFWDPLSEKVCSSGDCKQLLCFIVEDKKYLQNLDAGLVIDLDENADFRKILKIPDIPLISEEDFEDWEKDFGKKRFDELAKRIRQVFINNSPYRKDFVESCKQGIPPIVFFKKLTEALGEDYNQLETENQWLRYEPTE